MVIMIKKAVLLFMALLFLDWIFISNSFANGIIIADDDFIRSTFRDSSKKQIREFALNLSKNYKKVVLHLGRRFAFKRGGLFFYRTSKENLVILSESLQDHQVDLELWMLDSFGGEGFIDIYRSYESIISENLNELARLNINFKGIIIDLEWINLPEGNNGKKLIEIIRYLIKNLPNRQIKAFASVIDNDSENLARGYNQSEFLKLGVQLIPMLYVVDGGFYERDGTCLPYLSDNRIQQLKTYYRRNGYIAAVSLEGGLIIKKNGRFYFIKTLQNRTASIFKQLESLKTREFDFFTIETFKAGKPFKIIRNDGVSEQIRQDQELYWIQIKREIVYDNSYIWNLKLMKL